MKVFGIPIHQIIVLFLLLGAAHFAIAQLSERTTGRLTKKAASKIGL